ncbi:MAG: hypothetical protein HRU11_10865 [Parvularculaceae bacterium]|nr:hypothetical protein [Parvularculaceae bacterium]
MTRSLENARGHTSLVDINGGPLGGFRNKIINGNFDIWQRGTSQTTTGYGSADRWRYGITGTPTLSASQQTFAAGQTDVPGNPKYFLRSVVTAGSATNDRSLFQQRIEDVATLAGEEITVTFWAKADAAKDIAFSIEQSFGSGGSPSSYVTDSAGNKQSLSTSWQKFSVKKTIPSIASKTLGTNNDDYLTLAFWFTAGSDYDTRTNSLGHQTGTFDIARVSLVKGDATNEADPSEYRHPAQEQKICERYYQTSRKNNQINSYAYPNSGSTYYYGMRFPTVMRGSPTITLDDVEHSGFGTVTTHAIGSDGFRADGVCNASDANAYFRFSYVADAEL